MTTSGKIAINGSELFYERLGSGKHAVLLLNGALGLCLIFCLLNNALGFCDF